MHIIIDIREKNPLIFDTERYGEAWGELWRENYPHDTLSYLIFDSQIKKDDSYYSVPHGEGYWWKKSLITGGGSNEVYRSVNFSHYPPYEHKIRTLTHIFDHRPWLYPHQDESSFLSKKLLEARYKKIFSQSEKIIVPNLATGLECMELWGVQESHLEVIPYISPYKKSGKEIIPHGIEKDSPFFLYDGTYGSEAKILEMLKGFELYREKGGLNTLILHGFPGEELGNIIQIIRGLELENSTKLIGVVGEEERRWLYHHARAWIMLGGYYSGGSLIEMAYHHNLPMILSDIPSIRAYSDLRIHPNHIIEELPGYLKMIESGEKVKKTRDYTDKDIIHVYRQHLMGS